MPLPRSVAHFNKRYTNRFIEPVVRRSSGFAVVHHVGRSSGGAFTTPVNIFRDTFPNDGMSNGQRTGERDGDGPSRIIVALTYGPSADWIRNVESGPATIEFGPNDKCDVEKVELIRRDRAWSSLPRIVRLALKVLTVHDFALLTLSSPERDRATA